jgi:iron complex outermembrane receptor protein
MRKLLMLYFLSVLCSVSFCEADAQQSDSAKYQTDEVVITGTRTEKKIIDIPYPVIRIDQSQYKYSQKVAVDDVLSTVPGLFLQSRYGNHDVRIQMRGFGSRSNTGIRGVRILLDNIPESEPDGQTRIEAIDFQSVGKIEIVRGNSSSLYTNAPGGVINFINDIDFNNTSVVNFNQFGSFDLRSNGLKATVNGSRTKFLLTYNYHNYKGFREHSNDYWHILNTVLQTKTSDLSELNVLGYVAYGLIKLPGSISQEAFDEDPYQPLQRDIDRDAKRVSNKGRFAVRYNQFLDKKYNNEIEVTGYGTIKYFERTAATYRLFDRYGLGGSFKYVNNSVIGGRNNEFTFGGDLFYQTGPVEEYNNINGIKGDILEAVVDETVSNTGAYFLNQFDFINDKFSILLSGRYDKVVFNSWDRLLGVRSSSRTFEDFTPKAALNYKFTPTIAVYTSFGQSFDSPATNEMDNYPLSSTFPQLLNPDLKPQKSQNFEIGVKGNLPYRGTKAFNKVYFEVTLFNSMIEDEIIPFDVNGSVYYRNAGKTNRKGAEVGANIEVVRGLNWNVAYTYSDFVYDEYIARVQTDTTVTDVVFSGNFAPSVPKNKFATDLSYERDFSRNATGFIKTSFQYVSEMFSNDENTASAPSYSLLDASLGLDLRFNKFNVLLSGGLNNILDEVYVGFININADPDRSNVNTRRYYEAGAPRNWYASLNLGYMFR